MDPNLENRESRWKIRREVQFGALSCVFACACGALVFEKTCVHGFTSRCSSVKEFVENGLAVLASLQAILQEFRR